MGWQDAPIVGAPTAGPAPVAAPASWQDAPTISAPQAGDVKHGTVGDIVKSTFTGEGRIQFPDIPNIDALDAHVPWKAVAGLMMATDDKQKTDILQKALPEAKFTQDTFGNPMMTVGNQTVYVNKPGLRQFDLEQAGAQIGAFAGANRLIGPALGKLPGIAEWGKAIEAMPKVKAFLSGAAASAGLDLGAHAAGAEKVIDAPRAAVNGGIGVGAEMLSPLANKAYQYLANQFKAQPFIDQAGQLTESAVDALKAAGIDPQGVSDEFKATFANVARDAADPAQAAKLAQAQSLPVSVPQTRGNLSGLPSDQMTESMAYKGAYGQDAELTMRGLVDQQQEALRGNVAAIKDRMGGQLVERGQGGQQAQQALVEAQQATKKATSAAYDAAKGAVAPINPADVAPLADAVESGAATYLPHAPMASSQAQKLRALSENALDDAAVKDLFDWRRETSKLKNATHDQTEAAAFGGMLKEFDNHVEQTVKEALKSGDDDAARLWSRAVAIRRGEGRRFQSDDLIADLLEKEYAGGKSRLKIAPEQASNYIFGAADLGFITKPQLARDLSRLRARLGETSDAWRGLQEEAFMRFASKGNGASQGEKRMFSGVNFKKAWDEGWAKNGPTMRVLFDERTRKLVDTFAEVAARTTGKVSGGDNNSNTTVALSNIGQKLASLPFVREKVGLLIAPIIGAVGKMGERAAAREAIKTPLQQKVLPKGAAAGAGGIANLILGDDQ